MIKKREPIPFFTDNDVPDVVGEFLIEAGHSCVRLREVMLNTTKDPIVDAACRAQGLVLITHNHKDFKAISSALEVSGKKVKKLNRIDLQIHQTHALKRIKDALHLIEAEWYNPVPSRFGVRFEISMEMIRIKR